jgi:hypothetical protein
MEITHLVNNMVTLIMKRTVTMTIMTTIVSPRQHPPTRRQILRLLQLPLLTVMTVMTVS